MFQLVHTFSLLVFVCAEYGHTRFYQVSSSVLMITIHLVEARSMVQEDTHEVCSNWTRDIE